MHFVANVDLSLRASLMAAERRLGFLALGRWCKAMALGKQLAVYCLGAAVIAVSSLVCLISIVVVAYTRAIAT